MTTWHSLYIPAENTASIVERLHTALTQLGYARFEPFGLMPARPYKQSLRLFAAPARAGWVRIVGEPTPALVEALSAQSPLLWLSLARGSASIQAFALGGGQVGVDALPGVDAALVRRALQESPLRPAVPPKTGMPLDALPPDVQKLATGVDAGQAGRMFERLSGELMKRAGGDLQAARGLLNPQDAPDWSSEGGARLAMLARALDLPESWQQPDFTRLRDAYQAGERRRRKPDAPLFPGDAQALEAVPDALDYTPVFGGKDQ